MPVVMMAAMRVVVIMAVVVVGRIVDSDPGSG